MSPGGRRGRVAGIALVLLATVASTAGAESPSAAPASPWAAATIAAPDGWRPTDLHAWAEGLAMTVTSPAGASVWLSDDGLAWRSADPTGLSAQPTHHGLVTAGRDLLAWTTAATPEEEARTSMAISADGETWSVAPADGSVPFGTTAIEGIVRSEDGTLAAWGTDHGATGSGRAVQRLFTGDGWRWRERRLVDRRGQTMPVTAISPMGQRMVAIGRGRGWGDGSLTWIAHDPTSNWWPGHAPRAIAAVPSLGAHEVTVAAGSVAGAALVTAADGRRALWTSKDASDWWTVDPATLPFTLGPETALAQVDRRIVASGIEAATGRRGLWQSEDGRVWVAEAAGDPAPDVPGVRVVTQDRDRLVVALPGQVWSSAWEPVAAAESVALEPFTPLAEVEPGPVVRKPAGRPPVLGTDREPNARAERRGITLELWLPQRRLGIGEWLPATLRVTNRSARTVRHGGTLKDLRCHSVAGAVVHTGELFDPGESWTGPAARWKRDVVDQSTGIGLVTWPRRPRLGCADVGFESDLAPGASFTVTLAGWLVGPVGRQAVPAGSVPVTAAFGFWEPGHDETMWLRATASVRTDGRPWRTITPGQLADAALRTPGFKAWLDERDPPAWDGQVEADLSHERAPGNRSGALPDPPVVAQLGLYAESWTGRQWYWLIRLDRWTGRFYGGGQS